MIGTQKLPPHLAWTGEHASELAIAMLADGQTHLVDPLLVAHVETCAECTHATGEAAMLSVALESALRSIPRAAFEDAPEHAAKPPIFAIAVALVVAAIGVAPNLPMFPARLASIYARVPSLASLGGDSLAAARDAMHAPIGIAVSFAAALILMAFGVLVARALRIRRNRRSRS